MFVSTLVGTSSTTLTMCIIIFQIVFCQRNRDHVEQALLDTTTILKRENVDHLYMGAAKEMQTTIVHENNVRTNANFNMVKHI